MGFVSYELYSDHCIRYYKIISVITLCLGIPILVMGIWLTKQTSTSCETFLNLPLIITGAIVISLFLISIFFTRYLSGWKVICVQCNITCWLLFLLLGFIIFALVVTGGKGGGEPLVEKFYKEYRLEGYSHWLTKRVNDTKHWNSLKECLVDRHVCSRFYGEYSEDTQQQFFSRRLSSIESGCCKPSNDCNFQYVNPTKWTKPNEDAGANFSNVDCNAWDNKENVLCFNCQSCKAGLADDVKRKWNKTAIVSITSLSLLLVFALMGCIVAFYSELRPVSAGHVMYQTEYDD